jgi:hypothetical protein
MYLLNKSLAQKLEKKVGRQDLRFMFLPIHHLRKSFTLFLWQPHLLIVRPENFCGRRTWMQNKKYWRWNHPNWSIL